MAEVQRKSLPTEAEEKALATTLSKVKSPEKNDVIDNAKNQIAIIKNEIENGKFTLASLKVHLEAVKDVPNENDKAFYIGAILYAVNEMGYSVAKVDSGNITFKAGYGIPPVDNFQRSWNTNISGISSDIVSKALLYRTESFSGFLDENSDSKKEIYDTVTLDAYTISVIKKHPQLLEKDIISLKDGKISFPQQDNDSHEQWKRGMRASLQGAPGDADFLVAYFDDLHYHGGRNFKNIDKNDFTEYQKTLEKVNTGFDEFSSKLSNEELYALGIQSHSPSADLMRDYKNNTKEMLAKGLIKGGGFGLLLGFIGAIFGGKKGFLGGFFGGMFLGAGGTAVAGELWDQGRNTVSNRPNTPSETPRTENTTLNSYYGKINFSGESDATKKQTLESIWLDLTQNHPEFVAAPTSILSIFETSKTFEEQKNALKPYGILLTQDNEKNYKTIFAEILTQRKVAIGDTFPNETIAQYITRSEKHVEIATNRTEAQNNPTIENLNESQLLEEINGLYFDFQAQARNANAEYFQSKEEKKGHSKNINSIYQELRKYIDIYETKFPNNTQEIGKIQEKKLFLSRYFSDIGVIENDDNRNPILSLDLALSNLPENGKPQFPGMIEIAQRLRGQTGVSDYIVKEAMGGRSIQEILTDSAVSENFSVVQNEAYSEYETNLESYILALETDTTLTNIQKQSLDVIKDIQGIGMFNLKETNFQTSKDIAATLASVGAGIGAFALGVAVIPGPGWVVAGASAVAAGIVTTAGTMLSKGDNYFADGKDGLIELGINTVSFGAAGGAFKIARSIQGGAGYFSVKGASALGIESGADVMIGGTADYLRSKNAGLDISYLDTLENNLIWALAPLAMRGKGMYSEAREKLATKIQNQTESASFVAATGDTAGAEKIMQSVNDEVSQVRAGEKVEPTMGVIDSNVLVYSVETIANNLKNFRGQNNGEIPNFNGTSTWINERYQDLYKQLDSENIFDDAARGARIEILDREIAEEMIKNNQGTISEISNGGIQNNNVLDTPETFSSNQNPFGSGIPVSERLKEQASLAHKKLKKGVSLTQEKLGTLQTNRFFTDYTKNLQSGETFELAGTKFTKLENGRFACTIEQQAKELTPQQLTQHISGLSDDVKTSFISKIKETKLSQSLTKTSSKIDHYEIEISDGKVGKIRDTKTGNILSEDEMNVFIKKHENRIAKEFTGYNIQEGGEKLKNGLIKGFEKSGIKTAWEFIENAGYIVNKDGVRKATLKDNTGKFLTGTILSPATTMTQVISSISNKEWGDLFRTIVYGNKYASLFGEGDLTSRAFNSGLGRIGMVYGITEMDDFIDRDQSTGDEILDYAFYNYGGVVNTMILKYLGYVD